VKRIAAALAIVSCLAACAVPVTVETDDSARLLAARSWIWLPRPGVPAGDVELARVDQRVRSAAERALARRGFRRSEHGRPAFLLTYYAAVTHSIDDDAIAYAAGMPHATRRALNPFGGYDQGSLIVDVLDPQSGRLLWRGVGRDVFVAEQTPEERAARIDDALESIVSKLAKW
jgi:hypothetical protein